MKIGIITLKSHTNYGWILQAYALQMFLTRMGHNVNIIEEYPRLFSYRYVYWFVKRIVLKIWKNRQLPLFLEEDLKKCSIKPQQFIDENLAICKIKSFSTLKENDYDAFVVGSDQIWRPRYFSGNISDAFLGFSKSWNVKRIAYAPSFGTSDWEYSEKQEVTCRELIRQFDAVLVREISGVDLCRKYFGVQACHVVDPTLLLMQEDYTALYKKANTIKSAGTLLTYILDETPQKYAIVKTLATEMSLVPFRVNSAIFDYSKSLDERRQPSLETWLRGFADSEFVVTDSFHACVFSIIFHKQFVVIGNKARGLSRIQSLLKKMGLEDRLLSSAWKGCIAELVEIDYKQVDDILDKWRNESIDLLQHALND